MPDQLVVDDENTLVVLHAGEDFDEVSAQRQRNVAAEPDVWVQQRVGHSGHRVNASMRNANGQGPQDGDRRKVGGVSLPPIKPDHHASSGSERTPRRPHDRCGIRNVMQHAYRDGSVEVVGRNLVAGCAHALHARAIHRRVATEDVVGLRGLYGNDMCRASRNQHARDSSGATADIDDTLSAQIVGRAAVHTCRPGFRSSRRTLRSLENGSTALRNLRSCVRSTLLCASAASRIPRVDLPCRIKKPASVSPRSCAKATDAR